jgi:hypothetical protein
MQLFIVIFIGLTFSSLLDAFSDAGVVILIFGAVALNSDAGLKLRTVILMLVTSH